MVGSCFRGDGKVGKDAEVTISPRRVARCERSIGADSRWTREFLEIEIVPEGIGVEKTFECILGAEDATFVVVVSDQHGNFGRCALGVVREDDGFVDGGTEAAEDATYTFGRGDGFKNGSVVLLTHAFHDGSGI